MSIPLQAAEHYYLITEPIDGRRHGDLPVLEDPAVVRLLPRGGRRPDGRPVRAGLRAVEGRTRSRTTSRSASCRRTGTGWRRTWRRRWRRVPISAEVGVRKFFCGPESFTPDLQPVVGEAPELRNYFVAAGLNSIGILTGGGLGRVVAHWIVDGRPDVDVTGINIDRLHRYQAQPASTARTRTVESLGMVYQCHYPSRSMQTARGAKRSPLHDRLAAQRRVLPRRQRLGGRRLVRAGRASSPTPARCPGAGRTGSPTGRPSTAPPARA